MDKKKKTTQKNKVVIYTRVSSDYSPEAKLREVIIAAFAAYDKDLKRERRMTAKNKIKKTNGKSKRTK